MTEPQAATIPRKLPRQARAAATMEAILEGAAHILRRDGLGGFTTNHIAERAGVSIGSLYQYFPGKEAILAELIRRKRAALLGAFQTIAADEALDLPQAIDRLVAVGIDRQLADPVLSLALDYAEAALPLQAETRSLKVALIGTVAGLLARHGIADPAVAARDLIALARGMADLEGLYGEADGPSLGRRIRRAVFGYLGPGPFSSTPLPSGSLK
ncbi:MAG: TetR/AcrR family transcriptional regulator [Alphaproteobacteria bacterium]|jgi:AcrR family transcriptional regulator|nr:TetR/AcrR family transcriptional regulator [Alphaproteobacteria bacterium]